MGFNFQALMHGYDGTLILKTTVYSRW